jgi:hypothetical protein
VAAEAIEHTQREIVAAITAAGLSPNAGDLAQLSKAIKLLQILNASVSPDPVTIPLRDGAGHVKTAHPESEFDSATMGYVDEKVDRIGSYEMCEFYYFRHPTLRTGFQPLQGGLLQNAALFYPDAWEYLQSTAGQMLCKTEAEWQAMTTAIWATLADGTTVGWDGIGGAPWFAMHMDTGALRLPDVRGMYVEAAGFDSLGVAGQHGDGMRNIAGGIGVKIYNSSTLALAGNLSGGGAFFNSTDPITLSYVASAGAGISVYRGLSFDPSRVVPTGNANKPRAWGALACVYLGRPAS